MVSIITPHFAGRESYLDRTYASICQQDVEWEWIVQVDGAALDDLDQEAAVVITEEIVKDSRVTVSFNPGQLGTAITRNIALSKCQGNLFMPSTMTIL